MNNIFLYLNKSYINGKFVNGKSGQMFTSLNPFDDSVLSEIPLASLEQVRNAFKVADNTDWKNNPTLRRSVLKQLLKLFKQHKKKIIELLIKESGSTFVKAHTEFFATLNILKESIKQVDQIGHVDNRKSMLPGKVNHIHRAPKGVVSSIAPFNFPLHLSVRTVAPALALGNAVVHKPDVETGLVSGSLLAVLLREAGAPKEVFQSILTKSSIVQDEFFLNEHIDAISFTGSTTVGQHISDIVGKNLTSTALELGGNSPFVVLDDANIKNAARALVVGKFIHQGQVCMSANRIIVHEDIYDEFVETFKTRTEKLTITQEKDKMGLIGPIINKLQLQKTKKYIDMAKDSGEMVLEGKIENNFVTPFIFKDIDNDSKVAQTELFSPIALIIKAKSNDDAIKLANETDYGLSSSIFTKDLQKGEYYAGKIEAGMVHVNEQPVLDLPNIPFGGVKNSGKGRFGNPYVLDDFTDLKWVSVQKRALPYPF